MPLSWDGLALRVLLVDSQVGAREAVSRAAVQAGGERAEHEAFGAAARSHRGRNGIAGPTPLKAFIDFRLLLACAFDGDRCGVNTLPLLCRGEYGSHRACSPTRLLVYFFGVIARAAWAFSLTGFPRIPVRYASCPMHALVVHLAVSQPDKDSK